MLGSANPAIAVSDLDRAKKFYEETLRLKVKEELPDGIRFEAGDTWFFVYPSGFAGTNQATAMAFEVTDIEETIADLSGRGVTFEQYDLPGLKTDERGIVDLEGSRAAWFKDPDGNILAVDQRP